MSSTATKLPIAARDVSGGSRSVRRLRRSGRVPGVLYGGEGEPLAFDVDARELRIALASSGAVLELSLGDESRTAVLKEAQHHPVTGATTHIDLVRVRLDVAITATVPVEVTGYENAPGIKEGGVLEQQAREVEVEALPTSVPEFLTVDASNVVIGDTVFVSSIETPEGVSLVGEGLDEVVLYSVTAPRLSTEADEGVETETEVVGEAAADAGGDDSGESGGE
ncbi:MAG: 50S ribosomal protein L25 [Solirubrobacteraceae bacterium]|nr:50S ribosomal protein L25 [Solirubrobacteraceae bacterium]